MKSSRIRPFPWVQTDLDDLVERFNLRRVWRWLGLSGLVGIVGGLGALAFRWLTDLCVHFFWGKLIHVTPATAGGEHWSFPPVTGSPWLLGLVLAPLIGGLCSALLVYRFAPEAEGHGTDAAIRAYHRQRGRIAPRIPIVKLLASAFTLGSGGSAGREGPIAQIGAGFGSVLGTWLRLPDKDRRILLAAGIAAGIGASFRAPLAGAIFAAEVLYREPDIEAEVVVPALLSSIVSYSIYCSVHGFGHLFTGTDSFTFTNPRALLPYAVLGLVASFGAISFVSLFDGTTKLMKKLPISPYFKPAIGGAATGLLALIGLVLLHDTSVLGIMGSGYGVLQKAVSETGALGPSLGVLALVAFGKMVTTSLTIGSGGSGGVFGPSMVIGGALGAVVGTLFHAWWPEVVPNVGPFTIVGMAGFFAGAANTPISTLLMVSDITGNYSLLLPSMLVVGIALTICHRWTIYAEQVGTRTQSPAHRGEYVHDVLAELRVGSIFDPNRPLHTVQPRTPLKDILRLVSQTTQHTFPVVNADGKLSGIFSLTDLRELLYEQEAQSLIVAQDIANDEVLTVSETDSLQRAVDLLTIGNLAELPVVSDDSRLLGVITRADIIGGYTHRLAELRAEGELATLKQQAATRP